MFSYGRVPYPKIVSISKKIKQTQNITFLILCFILKPVNEVLAYIEQGYQMDKPDGCPDEIYGVMKDAWEYDRTLRPTFSNTLIKLNKIKSKILES